MREINALERRIATAEDEAAKADAMLWEQAQHVAAQLHAGMTQRALAQQWINARTGKPYSQRHVSYVVTVVEKFTSQISRPRFRDAYNRIANAEPQHPRPAKCTPRARQRVVIEMEPDDDEPDDDEWDERCVLAFVNRADQARLMATYDDAGPITADVVHYAQKAAAAWVLLAQQLQDKATKGVKR
jgi:hypothetical protein